MEREIMEDKSFELITKMYSEMMEFRKDVMEQFKKRHQRIGRRCCEN